MNFEKIAIIAAENNQQAIKVKEEILKKNPNFADLTLNLKSCNLCTFNLIIAVGGDGLMLHLLHYYEKNLQETSSLNKLPKQNDFPKHHKNLPQPYNFTKFYGINCGTVGFLMNNYQPNKNLIEIILKSESSIIKPLRMQAINNQDEVFSRIAINEVALFRASSQAAKLKIKINQQEKISLISDGVLIATPAGSTAYNLSVRGPIIPFNSNIIALTPISPFRPRNWRGALLPENSKITLEIFDFNIRLVNATADFNEIKNIKKLEVFLENQINFCLLFNKNHSLEERIIREQFNY